MQGKSTCNKKNCNCGAEHEYKDDLTILSNYSLKAAYTEHERRTEELGNRIISLEEYKRKPFVHLRLKTR